ncbi:hypothetical protein [Pseudarthrobacter sp. ATCC 49987]|uniref:hypothetical protein n=1 Tax=Pseudarthrobacter sp. ATCC 49987 TaxID=2698204 RepID=UPI00136BAE78|nr:hypothetical protein [Pseudarthrobacter sp. ATCC 49987]
MPPRSFEENVDEVARLLGASKPDAGMPTEAEPAGKLATVLVPGDYVVKAACAGGYFAKLAIVEGDGLPLSTDVDCDAIFQRFLRHAGGPITISATPSTGKPAAAGVTIGPNTDPRPAAQEDMAEWSSKQLKPAVPGELFGSAVSDSPTSFGMSAKPGTYELQFLCEGPSGTELSVASWSGAEVVAPVQVHCNGDIFKRTVQLEAGTDRVDFKMDPGGGRETRYAFRLVSPT